jgi:hypothetical protein
LYDRSLFRDPNTEGHHQSLFRRPDVGWDEIARRLQQQM